MRGRHARNVKQEGMIEVVMGQLSSRVQRLRDEIRHTVTVPPTQGDIERIQDRVADLLLRALWDERHTVSEQLIVLQGRVELEREGKLYRVSPEPAGEAPGRVEPSNNPHRHLFMPHPGHGDSEGRRYWQLQLLLQSAARSKVHASRLADHLGLSCESIQQAADAGAEFSVKMWSNIQYAQYLEEAIGALDSADPPLPFHLVERTVRGVNGNQFKLSPQEAQFVKMLIEDLGKPVTVTELKRFGIPYPAKVKGGIVKKFRRAEIELPIQSSPGAYLMLEFVP